MLHVPAPQQVTASVLAQLHHVHTSQTLPFTSLVADYSKCLQQCREQQVRLAQLDKEGAELREENAGLHAALARADALSAADWKAKAETASAAAAAAEKEAAELLRDKARLLEEVVAAGNTATTAKAQADSLNAQLTQARTDISTLRDSLSQAVAALEAERTARTTAAAELHASLSAREAAVREAETLRSENVGLVRRLVEVKEREAERMNEINKLHEETLAQVSQLRREATAEKEAADMIRARAGSMAAAQLASAAAQAHAIQAQAQGTTQQPASSLQGQASGTPSLTGEPVPMPGRTGSGPAKSPEQIGSSDTSGFEALDLKDLMRLPSMGGRADTERVLPSAPFRTNLAAHKGGCCALAVQAPGHLSASCGMDRVVQLWDLNSVSPTATPAVSLQGMMGAVNSVAFTCDAAQLLGAGADKSLHLWDATSGQTRHTLTGHSAAVTSVAASPLDARLAVSAGEDRTLKLWDLGRGFCVRSMPCTKMPNSLAMSRDGNTIITGHLDGCVCLWDVRQARSGGSGLLTESRLFTQIVSCVASTSSDATLLAASKDNTLALWDFRTLTTTRVLRAPGFTLGTIGSMGKGRCGVDMSPDGRFVAAGSGDGTLCVWDLMGSTGGSSGSTGGSTGRLGGGASGGSVKSLKFHKDAVVAAAWAADGGLLLSADKSGGIAFWSLTGLGG